jgi:uncharacterized damage-inducible protein DinB
MDHFAPVTADERSQLLAFLDEQRTALRAAVGGLTEAQARSTPTASSMSLAALLKHVLAVERRWVVATIANRPAGLWPVEDWDAEWQLQPGDTVEHLLTELAATAAETEAVVAAVPDLGAPCGQPDDGGWTVRCVLLHLVEELARHAGHADVIRESIDGATADRLGG